MQESDEHSKDLPHKPTKWNVIMSVLAALIGVQSHKNRERDMTHGNPLHFIIVGLIFVVLFVLSLVGIVKWVLP